MQNMNEKIKKAIEQIDAGQFNEWKGFVDGWTLPALAETTGNTPGCSGFALSGKLLNLCTMSLKGKNNRYSVLLMQPEKLPAAPGRCPSIIFIDQPDRFVGRTRNKKNTVVPRLLCPGNPMDICLKGHYPLYFGKCFRNR